MLVESVVLQQGAQVGNQLIVGAAGQITEQVFGIAALRWVLLGIGKADAFTGLAGRQGVLSALKCQRG